MPATLHVIDRVLKTVCLAFERHVLVCCRGVAVVAQLNKPFDSVPQHEQHYQHLFLLTAVNLFMSVINVRICDTLSDEHPRPQRDRLIAIQRNYVVIYFLHNRTFYFQPLS